MKENNAVNTNNLNIAICILLQLIAFSRKITGRFIPVMMEQRLAAFQESWYFQFLSVWKMGCHCQDDLLL